MMVLTKPAHELHSKANLASAIYCLGAGGRCAAPPQQYSSPGLKLASVAEARDRALSCSREVAFMRWLPVAFLTNSA